MIHIQTSDIQSFATKGNTISLEGLRLDIIDVEMLSVADCNAIIQLFEYAISVKKGNAENLK